MSTALKPRIYKAGDVIYREGEPSDAVYLIEQGEVGVLKATQGGDHHLLGILGPGKIFGETGVILDHPRSTTVRAMSDTIIKGVERKTFIGQFKDAPLALPLLKMLCERLVEANRSLAQSESGPNTGLDLTAVARMRLLAASDFVKNQIGHREIEITNLPFRIGRRAIGENLAGQPEADLALVVHDPLQMSPAHCAIQGQDGRLFIEDLGSEAGTIVNGDRIARFADKLTAQLAWGENVIVVGPEESSVRFLFIVERRAG